MAVLYLKRIGLLVALPLLLLSMQACQEFLTEGSLADATPEKGLISLRYEAEILTYQELGDAGKATALDKISAMAKAVRSKISVEIYEDGTSDWRLEKMTPKHDVRVNDQTPPNPMPQTKVTRLSRSGRGYFYGSDGALLKEHDIPSQSFSELVSRVREDPSAAYSVIGVTSKQQVAQLMANAQRDGAIIEQLGDGNITVSSSVFKATARARGPVANYKSVNIINPNLGVLVGSKLYDDKDQLVNQVFYQYKLGDDKNKDKQLKNKKLTPEALYQKTWITNDKTGKTRVTVTNTYFDNVSAIINRK